jgi:hypothetical protein
MGLFSKTLTSRICRIVWRLPSGMKRFFQDGHEETNDYGYPDINFDGIG